MLSCSLHALRPADSGDPVVMGLSPGLGTNKTWLWKTAVPFSLYEYSNYAVGWNSYTRNYGSLFYNVATLVAGCEV
jgi:hypothetical protein